MVRSVVERPAGVVVAGDGDQRRLGRLAAALVEHARRDDAFANDVDRLEVQSHRYARIGRWMIYGQIVLLCAGGTSFLLLMLMHFRRALYP